MESSLLLPGLKELWQVLEEYVEQQKLLSIGVSDVETDVFIALYDWAKVCVLLSSMNILLKVLYLPNSLIACDDSKLQPALDMNGCEVIILVPSFWRDPKI
jgi:glutamate--cysteine ligase regulatory subunit